MIILTTSSYTGCTGPAESLPGSLSFSPHRLVEEVKELCDGLELENEDVYMATTFRDFIQLLVRKLRGDDDENECVINYVSAAPGPATPPGT